MPPLAPADPASERALRASPLVPTLSFAALGLATMVAIGALGLAQQPSAGAAPSSPGIPVRPPALTLAGAPAEARAATPDVARVTPAGLPTELPGARLLRGPASPVTVVPVVDSSDRSLDRSGARAHAGSAPVAVGRGARLAAGLPGHGAAAGSSGDADGAHRPVAAARKPAPSRQPVTAPQRPGRAPVRGPRPTAPVPAPSKPSAPQGGVDAPTPDGTSVVPGPSPVQGPLLMAARPKGARPVAAPVPTTVASTTPVPGKNHRRSTRQQEQRSDGRGRHGERDADKAPGTSREPGHRAAARQHAAEQDHQDHRAHSGKQHRQAKQRRQAKQHRQAKQPPRPSRTASAAGPSRTSRRSTSTAPNTATATAGATAAGATAAEQARGRSRSAVPAGLLSPHRCPPCGTHPARAGTVCSLGL